MDVLLHRSGFYASDSRMSPTHHAGNWAALQAWLQHDSSIHAVICDVYGTLLEVHPGPAETDAKWSALWQHHFPKVPCPSLQEVQEQLQRGVARSHAASSQPFPEVDWVALFGEIVPFHAAHMARQHARLQRHCRLMPGAADCLRNISKPFGICSNAQAYTLMELRLALREADLRLNRFASNLTFWSFQHGTAKPNAAVFDWLLKQQSSAPAHLLMVGDRFDNDIQPAMEAGWSTWHLLP